MGFKIAKDFSSFCSKMITCLELEKRNSIGASGLPFSFFLHHFVSMRRMVTRVGALESPDPGGPFKYLEHVHRTSRKFFRAV